MEYNNIDKEIYQFEEIHKHLKPMLWAWICLALGAIGGYIYFTMALTSAIASLFLGIMIIGVFALATMLCYYTFGDSRAPYHTPSKQRLERTYFFYSHLVHDDLLDAVSTNDTAQLSRIKKSPVPELILVRYSDEAEQIAYMQVQQMVDGKKVPISPIIKPNK